MENVKTLILNNKSNSNFKCILNLNEKEKCIIKLYNTPDFSKTFALGIEQNEEIVKIPLMFKNNNGEFLLPKKINLSEDFFCAVVDVTNAFCPEIILSESKNSFNQNERIENAFVVSKPIDTSVLYEEDDDNQIKNLVDKNFEDDLNSVNFDSCAKCKYKKAFYEDGEMCGCFSKQNDRKELSGDNKIEDSKIKIEDECLPNITYLSEKNSPVNSDEVKLKEDIKKDENAEKEQFLGFYEQVRNQIDLLFEKYEREDVLEKIVNNSQWVKVKYDENSNFYVVGLIFNEEKNKVKYIAYGVPSKDNDIPPDHLKEYAQWLSINLLNKDSEGYWVVYQDAENGKSIKVDL